MKNIKRTHFLISIIIVLLIGCTAPKKGLEEGQYKETIERADKAFEELDESDTSKKRSIDERSRREPSKEKPRTKLIKEMPSWVENRPTPEDYIVGIGMAGKTENKEDDIKRAKSEARKDLAAQIRIKIESETDYRTRENTIKTDKRSSWYSEQDISTRIHSMVAEEIEGIEFVDSWESEDGYWYYCRLSKAELARQIKEKLENSKKMAVDFYKKAMDYKNGHQYINALEYLGKAYNSLIDYLGKPVEVMLDGSSVIINNEIERQISSILSNLKLVKLNDGQSSKIGSGLRKPLIVKVVYGQDYPVKSVKLNFNVITGDAEITKEAITNSEGTAECQVDKILKGKGNLKIKAVADLKNLLNLEEAYAKSLIKNSFVNFSIEIRKKTIFMKVTEESLGKKRSHPFIESYIKDLVAKNSHVDFSDNRSDADCLLEVKVTTRRGNEYQGIYFSYADINVKLIDLSTDKQIYQREQTGVKGAGLNYEQASMKALTNIKDKIKDEFIRDIVSAIEGQI